MVNATHVMKTPAQDVQITTPDVNLANVNLVLKKPAKVVLGIDPIAGQLDNRVKSATKRPTNPASQLRVLVLQNVMMMARAKLNKPPVLLEQ